ncbi:hypothetical protein ACN6MY_01515 [Peribacillus sp. B-H-3]|uniref:hypothetical protein n=1 Tax=Peribacillus sp. B-H-3 TaxID=3400420 RepID=UPI003B0294C8
MNQNFTMVIADDEKEIRDAIEIYLSYEGIKAVQAANGAEVLRSWMHRGGLAL